MILVGPVMAAYGTCCLVSDDGPEELANFAAGIGIDPARGHWPAADAHAQWEAAGGASPHPGAPHVDLTEAERDLAVVAGAREVSGRELEARCAGTPSGWRGCMWGGS